jgi:hypothetical protein
MQDILEWIPAVLMLSVSIKNKMGFQPHISINWGKVSMPVIAGNCNGPNAGTDLNIGY